MTSLPEDISSHSPNLGDRDAFGLRQAEMTQRWFESVKARFGDVDGYIKKRQVAYLDRWQEAVRFFPKGSKVLDVGGGNLYESLLKFLSSHGIDYWYQDVDPAAVAGSRALAQQLGFSPNKFIQAFNDHYPYENQTFDAVFSSHCIEHSINLPRTFTEINRILRHDGLLTMAVPLGWEENPEHPYFFDQQNWILMVEDFGFEVRVAQIGREYPESGVDLFIAARKIGDPSRERLDVSDFTKASYSFARFDDPRISYSGQTHVIDDGRAIKLVDQDWNIQLQFSSCSVVIPVFVRHNWSGIIKISTFSGVRTEDLFNWFPTVQPLKINTSAPDELIEISSAGKNIAGHSTEVILYGVMYC